jgi:hypothetical protein
VKKNQIFFLSNLQYKFLLSGAHEGLQAKEDASSPPKQKSWASKQEISSLFSSLTEHYLCFLDYNPVS